MYRTAVGVRINQDKPDIVFKQKTGGGISELSLSNILNVTQDPHEAINSTITSEPLPTADLPRNRIDWF